MNRKRVIIISIIAIVLLIGGSFAYWRASLVQTSTNNIATSCFDLSLSESNPIDLQSAFPIKDSEGKTLTPYEFTITNNCTTYAYYEVNLEVLNNTNLDSRFIKIELDDETPVLLSSKTVTTTTLSNASTSYKLAKAFMHASESKTYHLRLWIDESVTLADNITEKEFSGKITIRATYKPEAPSSQEECELEYGEGAAACSIIANADTTNSKCLQVNEDGSIINPYSTMSDSDTPIICSMEDDYGTSYYLRGNHQDNNVKFADSCWKIIRVTGTGGIKMIYNGDLDSNGKCTTTEGTHNGFTGQELSLSGNKLYGSSYTKEGTTYTLSDTSTLNWPNDSSTIIGKYTCNSTSSTCSTLYAVTGEYSSSQAYSVKLDQSTNYAQIGTSAYNASSASPAYVGYMFNDAYTSNSKTTTTSGATIISRNQANTSNYYYGDTISYTGGYYYITNADASNVVQLDWASNYETNLVGKYTCKGTSTYNATTIRCSTAYKVLDTTTKTNYMIAENLTGGRTSIGTINLATSYTVNSGNYELTSPVQKTPMEWYNGYSSYNNYYYCADWNQTTCTTLYKITSASQTSLGTSINLANNYYYGSSYTYDSNNTRPYTLTDTVQFWDISDSTNKTSLNTHHYTCFYSTDNTCQELYFIYYLGIRPCYIKLNGNETVSDALDKMLRNDNINVKNSNIKGVIDYWYKENILGTTYESYLEDTVFCNDRTIYDIGGWSETGTLGTLYFNGGKSKYYLKCPNKRDAFTVSDTTKGNGSLTYPVGLLTKTESYLVGNANARKTGAYYWSSAPYCFYFSGATESSVNTSGDSGDNYVSSTYGARPAVSLRPGTTFVTGGDGSASNPYEVDMNN